MNNAFIRCRGLTRIYPRGTERIPPLDALDLDMTAKGSRMGSSTGAPEVQFRSGLVLRGVGHRDNLQ